MIVRSRTVGLICLFGIAVGCGSPPATLEERAVAKFEEIGGRVVRNADGRPTQLYLASTGVTDEVFAQVVHLTELKHVELLHGRITDQSIQYLEQLPNLGSVDVSFSRVTQKGVDRLQKARPSVRITYSDPYRYPEYLRPSHVQGEDRRDSRWRRGGRGPR